MYTYLRKDDICIICPNYCHPSIEDDRCENDTTEEHCDELCGTTEELCDDRYDATEKLCDEIHRPPAKKIRFTSHDIPCQVHMPPENLSDVKITVTALMMTQMHTESENLFVTELGQIVSKNVPQF